MIYDIHYIGHDSGPNIVTVQADSPKEACTAFREEMGNPDEIVVIDFIEPCGPEDADDR